MDPRVPFLAEGRCRRGAGDPLFDDAEVDAGAHLRDAAAQVIEFMHEPQPLAAMNQTKSPRLKGTSSRDD